MAIQGLFSTDDMVTDERPLNWRSGILLQEPGGTAPLAMLTALMKSESTDDPEFKWWEKVMSTQRIKLSGDITNVATTMPVLAETHGGAQQCILNTLLLIEKSGEIIRVSATPTLTTTMEVERDWGQTGVTPLAVTVATDNPYLSIIGTAHPEGAALPPAVAYAPSQRQNYTQIFRTPLSITRTARLTTTRTGEKIKEMKREALQMHMNQMERAFFFGVGNEVLTGATPQRSMDGINQVLRDEAPLNIIDGDSPFNMEDLENWMQQIFQYGSDEKMAFLGDVGILNINRVIRKNTQFTFFPNETEYGMNVGRLISPFGSLVMKRHRLFNGMTVVAGKTYAAQNSSMVVLDMANLRYRPFKESDTKYLADRQANGVDGDDSEYLTECSLEVGLANTHVVINDLTDGVVDA